METERSGLTVSAPVRYKHRSILVHGVRPQALASLMTLIPYNRIGQPVDISNLAVFLASDASDYITGASIFIDGGMTVFEGFAEGG